MTLTRSIAKPLQPSSRTIADNPELRVAYLNTQYPSLSHTFIEREVHALRAQGIDVRTFSIRRPRNIDQLSQRHRQATAQTCYLLSSYRDLAATVVCALFARPRSVLRAIVASQRLATPGIGARLRHLAYVAEALRLDQEMRRRGLSHVHVHMANNGAAVAFLACRYDPNLTYSLSIHGSAEFFQVNLWRLTMKAEGAMFVRCISHFCMSQVMAWTGTAAWKRFHMVHCGVDAAAFRPKPRHKSGTLRILTVGRLDPIKGYSLLLEACRQLTCRGVDWHLDMVGDGPLRPVLEMQVAQLGLADRVVLSGAVGQDDIQQHFDRADVMVISSFMEGVPVVLMEAMAKELAVVATRVGGIPELIEDGTSGLLVTPASVDSLTDALERLYHHPEHLYALGSPARKKILDEFSVDDLGVQMAQLFRCYLREELRQSAGSANVPEVAAGALSRAV